MNASQTRRGWFDGAEFGCEELSPVPLRAYRLVLLGPPGVGKGTQAELLAHRLGACHLSTGDLFRTARNERHPSPAMAAALQAMDRGELVSDELVIDTVRERAACLQCLSGFLLDGYPRTLAQAAELTKTLQQLGVELDGVISYELPLERVVDRISGRRTCGRCQAVFHMESRPPAVDDVCNLCGGILIQRDDDRPAAVRVRLQAYQAESAPVRDYYGKRGELISVPAGGEPLEIYHETLRLLQGRAPASE